MIRQGELIQELAQWLASSVAQPWQKLEFRVRAIVSFTQANVFATAPGADPKSIRMPRDFPDKQIAELRSVMYRPGSGTWFSMELTITQPGDVDVNFNYTDEPAWSHEVSPLHFADDQAQFPRDEASQPEWLKKQLALAAAR